MPSWRYDPRDVTCRPDWLTARPFAHRGLHGHGRIENSRAAFAAAIDAGFGIELDVRAARDGTVFVFHDATFDRLCGRSGAIDALDGDAVAAITLKGSAETIPTLAEILALVAGRAPLLIELKSFSPTNHALCWGVAELLAGYGGPAGVMSFDPGLLRWFARQAPLVTRGLVISEQDKRNFRGLLGRSLSLMFSRPGFLAYDVRSLPSPFAAYARELGLPVLTWTVRGEADRATAATHADQIIFERETAA
jgi:glycerophosphoryl diester phosphodiesterase